jgi:DNA polymerase-4
LRFEDFSRATRSHTLTQPTAHTETLLGAVRSLFASALPIVRQQGLTLVGVSVGNLDDADAVQLVLPFRRRTGDALDATLDEVREKYGSSAVTRAAFLGRDLGLTVPLLPD